MFSFETVKGLQAKLAEKAPKVMPQEKKAQILAGLILTRFYRDRSCSHEQLVADAAGKQLTKRIGVTTASGIGGEGGLRLHRVGDDYVLNRDNVLILSKKLGQKGFEEWMASIGIDYNAFGVFFDSVVDAA